MKTYWDYSERERSELAEEQVDSLLSVELMEAGVVRSEKPAELPVAETPSPTLDLWTITCGYSDSRFGFHTAEQAANALVGAVPITAEYIGGKTYHSASGEAPTIAVTKCYDPSLLANYRKDIERAATAAAANKKALEDYKANCDAVSKVVSGVWEDYRDQCSEARRLQRIIRTFAEYTKTAEGDEDVARKFLAKAYSQDDIDKAFEWNAEPVSA